jgi:hypothetical protein
LRATSDHVSSLVAERHATVRQKFERLLAAIAANDAARVGAANVDMDDALQQLGLVVAREHWPNWLTDLQSNTSNYRNNHANGKSTWIAHLRSLMQNWEAMENHVWFADKPKESIFDVDGLIKIARSEFIIDELFDRIIITLNSLADCEELDSAKAIHDLEGVIAVLRKAKSGSFTAQVASWQFVRRFIPNLISSYLRNSSMAGPAIEAFETTAEELDINIGKAKDRIADGLIAAAAHTFRSEALKSITANQIPALPTLSD